jgi:hypothetical protein
MGPRMSWKDVSCYTALFNDKGSECSFGRHVNMRGEDGVDLFFGERDQGALLDHNHFQFSKDMEALLS